MIDRPRLERKPFSERVAALEAWVRAHGRKRGESVFRSITPLACLLIRAGICVARPGELVLRDSVKAGD